MDNVLTGGEAHGTSDAVGGVFVEKQFHDEHALHQAVFAEHVLGGFSDDALVGFTVDHDLPAAGTDGLVTLADGLASGLGLGTVEVVDTVVGFDPNGKAPVFKQFDGVVNVTAYVEDEVFADQTHKVGADHADVVVSSVVFQEGVDGGKALGHSAGTLKGSLVNNEDFGSQRIAPVAGFNSSTGGAHAAADDQQVNVMFFNGGFGNGNAAGRFLNRDHRHSSNS